MHDHKKQYSLGEKSLCTNLVVTSQNSFNPKFALDFQSGTFVVFAKFSYSIRIRYEVQFVQVASPDYE